jgi:hypothetical protein
VCGTVGQNDKSSVMSPLNTFENNAFIMRPQESKHDRESRNLKAPIKKDGAGNHNWGSATEDSIEHHDNHSPHVGVVTRETFEAMKGQ